MLSWSGIMNILEFRVAICDLQTTKYHVEPNQQFFD